MGFGALSILPGVGIILTTTLVVGTFYMKEPNCSKLVRVVSQIPQMETFLTVSKKPVFYFDLPDVELNQKIILRDSDKNSLYKLQNPKKY